jgi:hypothetical protein
MDPRGPPMGDGHNVEEVYARRHAGPITLQDQHRRCMSKPTQKHEPVPVMNVFGALALELVPDSTCSLDVLTQSQAGTLAAFIAADLARFAAQAASLQLTTVGAHYDAVELLRPGWPLHHQLEQFAARAPLDTNPRADDLPADMAIGRIIAFGSDDASLPTSLMPSSDYIGGPLRLLPFVLSGDGDTVGIIGDVFERDLLERGMAGAATALAAQELFDLRIEHARYLTLHDLAAMMALQYEHVGLAPLWPLIETALLSPRSECWLDAPPEPLVHYADGEARIALFSPSAWHARHAAGLGEDTQHLERRFEYFQARQRQFATVLQAHGIAVLFVQCDTADDTVGL